MTMPSKLIVAIAILSLQAIGALAFGTLALVMDPGSLVVPGFYGVCGLLQLLLVWGLWRGKDGVRSLVAVLSLVGAAGQVVMGLLMVRHSFDRFHHASDLAVGLIVVASSGISLLVAWCLTRRDVKRWMAEKTMPGAELDAV